MQKGYESVDPLRSITEPEALIWEPAIMTTTVAQAFANKALCCS